MPPDTASAPPRPVTPLRVLVCGRAGEFSTESSLVRTAARLGHAARVLDVAGWTRRLGPLAPAVLLRQADRFAPDVVVLLRHAGRLDERTLAALAHRRRAFTWYMDFHDVPDAKVVRAGRVSERLFVTCPTMRDVYVRAGIADVRWLPMALDPEIDFPEPWAPGEYECDVGFIGSGQFPERNALLARVATVARLQIRGAGWERGTALPVMGGTVRGEAFRHAVRGAAISLGAFATRRQASVPACISNRVWKVLGCGGFFLGPASPAAGVLYQDGRHVALYEDEDDAVAQVRHWLARPDERAAIAAAGRAHALAHHTYERRLCAMLGDEPLPDPPAGC
ncbi:MAG TPA: glycosyltransferase [Gemmatimonadales bacterium]|nr:glycosyltransferase [Gemmatimonadales bacterium]